MAKKRAPKRVSYSLDPVAADLVAAVSARTGEPESTIVSRLIRRYLLTDVSIPPPPQPVDETTAAQADLARDDTAARIDAQRGYRAAG